MKSLPIPEGKILISTKEEAALVNPSDAYISMQGIDPCNHEEADTRLLLHIKHAYDHGFRELVVAANDSDVVVICIALYSHFPGSKFWFDFGTGKHRRYIAVHDIATHLGEEKSAALLFLHAFSGCDTVSSICNIGKKTVWDTWTVLPEVTPLFVELAKLPESLTNEMISLIERFVVLLYKRTSPITDVNTARAHLFSSGNRQIDNIPPTSAALLQHLRRAILQNHVWYQSLTPLQNLPDPSDWGWLKVEEGWQPFWTTLPEAAKACLELIKCGCQKGCSGRCKCHKFNLSCTYLCVCAGQCDPIY